MSEVMTKKDDSLDNGVTKGSGSSRLNYQLKGSSKRWITSRRTDVIYPVDTRSINVNQSGQTVSFNISGPDGSCIDPQTVELQGTFQNTGADGIIYSLSQGIFSVIERIRVTGFNGEVIFEGNHLNILQSLMMRGSCAKEYFKTVGSEFLMGPTRNIYDGPVTRVANADVNPVAMSNYTTPPSWGTRQTDADLNSQTATEANVFLPLQRQLDIRFPGKYFDGNSVKAASGGRANFCLPLWLFISLFQQDKYIPYSAFKRLNVEIQFVKPKHALFSTTNNASPSYTLHNLEMVYDSVVLNSALNYAMQRKLKSGGIQFVVKDYHSSQHNVAATDSQASVTIQKSVRDASAFFWVFQNAAKVDGADWTDNFHDYPHFGANLRSGDVLEQKVRGVAITASTLIPRTVSWYVQIGPVRIPDQPINTVPRELVSVQKAFGRYGDTSNQVFSLDTWTDGLALHGLNLETDPVALSGMILTGYNLTDGIQLQLNIDNIDIVNPSNVAKRITCFLEYSRTITFKQEGDSPVIVIAE